MKLNKILLAGLLSLGGMTAANANGVINFQGQVVDTPCSIGGGSGVINVDFGTVSLGVLTPGQSSSAQTFDIQLDNCAVTTALDAEITFQGAAGHGDTFATAGTAQNIGIEINGGSGVIAPGGKDVRALVAGNNTLSYTAAVVADSDALNPVAAGDFTAVANYTIAYK